MKEACKKVNMYYETLKYYCNKGLVSNVKKDANNYMVFNDNNIAWINSLFYLKNFGMSISEIKKYLNFYLRSEKKFLKDKKY